MRLIRRLWRVERAAGGHAGGLGEGVKEGVCFLAPYSPRLQVHYSLSPRTGFQGWALRNLSEDVMRGGGVGWGWIGYGGSHGVHPTKSQGGIVLAVALISCQRDTGHLGQ